MFEPLLLMGNVRLLRPQQMIQGRGLYPSAYLDYLLEKRFHQEHFLPKRGQP
jgi:hypothetical protein